MKVIFLGTGEAFDENYLNNSSLVLTGKTALLLDCGMSAPYQLWKYNNNQNLLEAVFISHFHADHCFGLPALLTRMWEEKRKKDLTIISSNGRDIKRLIDFGYKNIYSKLGFKIIFQKYRNLNINDLSLSFAKTKHSIGNYAVKVEGQGKSICYSGDGMFSEEAKELYRGCDLLIHEAYLLNKKKEGHACIKDLIRMAEQNNIKCLALTHINRFLRKKGFKVPQGLPAGRQGKTKIIIPKPFDKYNLGTNIK